MSEKRLEAIKGLLSWGLDLKLLCEIYRSVEQGISLELLNLVSSIQLFEMYSQLLEEAIAKKQGQEHRRQKSNAELNLQIDAYLPNEYIQINVKKLKFTNKFVK